MNPGRIEEFDMTTWAYRWGVTAAVSAGVMVSLGTVSASPPADEPVRKGDRLIYPEGVAIPRSLTSTERRFLRDHPLSLQRDAADPPTGPIYCVPEYAPMDGILIAWESFTTLLRQMAMEITTTGDADLYVAVDSQSERSSVYNTLSNDGVDMDRVHFVVRTTNTVWIRDYGPRYVYEGDCRAIVDHTYNRPRPDDNALNAYFAGYKNHALYEIPLIHGGGNYHLNGLGMGNTTRLIVSENPDLTEQEIYDLWLDYQNLETTFWDPFPSFIDSTQHIDMWMQIVGDQSIVISDWPMNSGSTQDQICDNAADEFTSMGWTVTRVPARSVFGTHYTYTNVVMCNDLILVPFYTRSQVQQHNAEALAAWQSAAPDRTIVQLDCEQIVQYAGVMHCIVMHIPAPSGGESPTAYLKNYRGGESLDPGDNVEITWISDDDLEVTSVDILLSTDGGGSFGTTIVDDTVPDGSYVWTVPDIATTQARLRIVAHDADGNTGFDESDDDITINGTAIPGDLDGNGVVNVADLLTLLADWGDCVGCPADLDDNGVVDVQDLLALLANWG
jgi:agmatine/peptidylarginine deiminase